MSKNPRLIILVATHKPCILPSEDVYMPIHCGRAVSKLDLTSLTWMRSHTVGDDTGENISKLNPYFCELTALYWAWKNYDHLGAPDRIGLCHYRRYFMNIGGEGEITVPIHYLHETIREQFNRHHDARELSQALALLPTQGLKDDFERYLNQKRGYFFNMFVLPKDIFFEYCELIFGVLLTLLEKNSWQKLDTYQRRMPGFLAERLTGGFIYHLKNRRGIPLHETLTILPIFNSYTMTKRQAAFTSYLAKYCPMFPELYSIFLSAQTHFYKH